MTTIQKLDDKFNLLTEPLLDLDVLKLFDNYSENYYQNNERIYHTDLLYQLKWFGNINCEDIIMRHSIQYCKQKKQSMRMNIKKGLFQGIVDLNKICDSYSTKVNHMIEFTLDRDITICTMYKILFDEIISDPTLINILETDLSSLDKSIYKNITNIYKFLCDIPDKSLNYRKWFYINISNGLKSNVNINIMEREYHVPENIKEIIYLKEMIKYYHNAREYYVLFPKHILKEIIMCITKKLTDIIKINNLEMIDGILRIYKNELEDIFKESDMIINNNMKIEMVKELIIKIKKLNQEGIDKRLLCSILNNIYMDGDMIILKMLGDIFSTNMYQDYIIDEISQCILMKRDTRNIFLNNMIKIISTGKDKDIFMERYNRMLMSRLLDGSDLRYESEYMDLLRRNFSTTMVRRGMKIIEDMSESEKIRGIYKCDGWIKENVIISSYDNWDINQSEGVLRLNNMMDVDDRCVMMRTLSGYTGMYKDYTKGKSELIWYLHFGEVIFEYKGVEIKMLPIQFLVLEMVSNGMGMTKDKLLNDILLNGYNKEFKMNIITSLIIGKILILSNNIIHINDDIEQISVNYIDIFMNNMDYGKIWNQRRNSELVMNRFDIVSSCINHIVKKQSLHIDSLYIKTKNIIDVFELDRQMFDDVIINMIKKDYIYCESDNIHKYAF